MMAISCSERLVVPVDSGRIDGSANQQPDGKPPPLDADTPGHRFIQVAVGVHRSCAIRDDLRLICWGDGEGFTGVAAGRYREVSLYTPWTCAVDSTGALRTWDMDAAPPGGAFTEVAANVVGCYARQLDGMVHFWSEKDDFSLGHNPVPPPIPLHTISSGFPVSCGLMTNGQAACWGGHTGWRLLEQVPTDTPFEDLATGYLIVCGITSTQRRLRCYLPPGWQPEQAYTEPWPGQRFVQVGAGFAHVCGLHEDGGIRCWIAAKSGLRPEDPQPNRAEPPPGHNFVSIAVGQFHGCAIDAQGLIQCWGGNTHGQLDAPHPDSF